MAKTLTQDSFNCGDLLFLNEEFSDVEIFVKTLTGCSRFPCHRAILSAASEVFATMFSSVFVEGQTGTVVVPDATPQVMEVILRYVYKGKAKFEDWKNGCDVLRVAHKYQITSLFDVCQTFLSKRLSLKNVAEILDISLLYDLEPLKEQCMGLCKEAAFVVLRTRAFRDVREETVKLIISTVDLNVDSEIDVFEALWSWARMECCRKERPLTEANIFEIYAPISKHIDFEFMNDVEISYLPKCIRDNISKSTLVSQTDENNNDSVVALQVAKNKKVNLPLRLHPFFTTFALELNKPASYITTKGDNVTCLRFSVDTEAYLLSFRLVSLPQRNMCYLNSVQLTALGGITVCSAGKGHGYRNLSRRPWMQEDRLFVSSDVPPYRDGCHEASAEDDTEVHEFDMEATRLLFLKPELEYVLELYPTSCDVKWPRVDPITDRVKDSEIEVLIHSKACWGVTSMKLLHAS